MAIFSASPECWDSGNNVQSKFFSFLHQNLLANFHPNGSLFQVQAVSATVHVIYSDFISVNMRCITLSLIFLVFTSVFLGICGRVPNQVVILFRTTFRILGLCPLSVVLKFPTVFLLDIR